jgi:hypothetical protein
MTDSPKNPAADAGGEQLYVLRPAEEDDLGFVIASWVQSYRQQALARDAGAAYPRQQRRIIQHLLEHANVLVACAPDEPRLILGYAVTGPQVVHYVYVKQDFRRIGIARALVRPYLAAPTAFTHKTHHPIALPAGWTYCPAAVFFPDLVEQVLR